MSTLAPIPLRRLGRNGPLISSLGFGAAGLSAFYGPIPTDPERLALLSQCYDIGERFWDSSNVYGDSEGLIGRWITSNPEKRDEIFIATKFGLQPVDGTMIVNNDPGYARKCCDDSLKRLCVDTIDLFYCHRLDGKTPVEDVIEEMAQLKREDKIRCLGLSDVSAETLLRACKVHHIDAVQMEYSPFTLDIESEASPVLEMARSLGVATVAYCPLGRGLLTGKITSYDDISKTGDFRSRYPRFSRENFYRNVEIVKKFGHVADTKGCTPSQLALAWLMAQGDDIFPIPGTKSPKYLMENVGSVCVHLSQDDIAEVRRLVEEFRLFGPRAGEAAQHLCFVDTPPKASRHERR